MVLRLLIDAVHSDETRVVIADGNRIHDFDFVTAAKQQVKGNIYLAKITRVEPSLQAAFVEYGGGKQGFLPFAEIHPDYYQIPMADRKRLLEEVEGEADEENDAPSAPASNEQIQTSEPKADAESANVPVFNEIPERESDHHSISMPEEALPAPTPASAHEEHAPVAEANEAPEQHSAPMPQEGGEPARAEERQHHSSESGEGHEIETLSSEEDAVREARPVFRRYKIQEVIKRNQIVLVQVIKEERGNKGVSLTTFISLAGRYCVLMPNSPKGGGISRKIMSGDDRKRLKEISAELKTARGMSAIIRTAGIDRTRAEIKRDYEYLVKLWETIREQTLSSTAPALIYEEGDLIKRTIRDLYTGDIEEIIVEGEEGYNQAKEFLRIILPSHAPKVKLHQEKVPLFYAYNIEDQLSSMYDSTVKLRSGGYIVLNPTEALISIDVNSGRSTGERNIEETASKTNLEAAAEIARQLRLRDLAGLIVIDFIDMMDSRNRRGVERALKDALKLDRAKIQLGRISPFGLLEMSRQRLRPSLSETSNMPCPHCLGKGVIRSDSSVSLQIIRSMEKEAASGQFGEIKLTVTPSVALHLLNAKRDAISGIEQKYDIHVTILADSTLAQGIFRFDKVKGANARRANAPTNQEPVSLDQRLMEELPPLEEGAVLSESESEILVPSESLSSSSSSYEERPHRRGRRGGRGRRNGGGGGGRNFNDRGTEPANPSSAEQQTVTAEGGFDNAQQDNRPPRSDRGERGDRSNGNRGGRGRRSRNWRDRRPREDNNAGAGQTTGVNQSAQQSSSPRSTEHHHRAPSGNPSAMQPTTDQGSQDSQPKKGWWRRIVES